MIIIDASVVTAALTEDGSFGRNARAALARDTHWAAPAHLPVESANGVRNLWRAQKITEQRASAAINALHNLTYDEVSLAGLMPRIWQLRHNITPYDAAYVATAELLGVTLVTADVKLSRAPGIHCAVRVVTR